MTTESTPGTRSRVSPLLGALASGAVAVLVLVVVAALTDGRPAVVGAASGGVLTLVVFALGVAVVGFVARLLPSASLLVALMTYVLQLLVLALVVAALDGSGVAGDGLSRGWFAAGVIAVTVLWMVGQLVAATRQRIPAYETTETPSSQDEREPHPGGER
jgi:ATP synthase protein I